MNGFAAVNPLVQIWAEATNVMQGRYPGFVFGAARVPGIIPIFSFHDVTEAGIVGQLDYLNANGYATLTVGQWVERKGESRGERLVTLTFDDGHASLWGIVYPALKERGMTATAYLLPGEMQEATEPRPFGVRTSGDPLVTWPEAMAMSDVIEIGSHSMYHQIMFVSDEPVGTFTEAMREAMYLVDRPMIGDDVTRAYPAGTTLYRADSRLSEKRRYNPADGTVESEEARRAAIERAVTGSKRTLEERLGKPCDHFCFPFAIGSVDAVKAVAEAGYVSGAWGVVPPRFIDAAPHVVHLPRIKDDYLYRLPGAGRWSWGRIVAEKIARRRGRPSAFTSPAKGDQRRVAGERADG